MIIKCFIRLTTGHTGLLNSLLTSFLCRLVISRISHSSPFLFHFFVFVFLNPTSGFTSLIQFYSSSTFSLSLSLSLTHSLTHSLSVGNNSQHLKHCQKVKFLIEQLRESKHATNALTYLEYGIFSCNNCRP